MQEAARGGHYHAVVHSSLAGPKDGQALVDRIVELINSMFREEGRITCD